MDFIFSPMYVDTMYVYDEHWTAFLGEELTCQQEIENVLGQYAVTVKKDTGETVSHMLYSC